jgi:hypothetical protein
VTRVVEDELRAGEAVEQSEASMLVEYAQLCEYHRHEQRAQWTILSLAVTAELAVVGLAYARIVWNPSESALFACVGVGIWWTAVSAFIHFTEASARRIKRAMELEGQLGMLNVVRVTPRRHQEDDPFTLANVLGYSRWVVAAAGVMWVVVTIIVAVRR